MPLIVVDQAVDLIKDRSITQIFYDTAAAMLKQEGFSAQNFTFGFLFRLRTLRRIHGAVEAVKQGAEMNCALPL